MEFNIKKYAFGHRPPVQLPSPEFYKQLGESGIRQLVSRQYDLLRQSAIKNLFAIDDEQFNLSKQHSADFMIQICGGPDYFNQHRGNPMMSKRHAPFKITPEGRVVWLTCYKQALSELHLPENLIESFWNYLHAFSAWMVNNPSLSIEIKDIKNKLPNV